MIEKMENKCQYVARDGWGNITFFETEAEAKDFAYGGSNNERVAVERVESWEEACDLCQQWSDYSFI